MIQLPECPATIEDRIMLEHACNRSFAWRAAVKKRAAEDVEWFIDFLCMTYDPRKEAYPHHLPFLLYPIQRQYLAWLLDHYEKQEDVLTEKSRDMGATWLNLCRITHHWLFHDAYTALLGSRKEDYVSDGTLNSLFGRIEYILRHLPTWILPKGFSFKEHIHKLKITNPESGNSIEGESANAQFSRQGRYSEIMMDEGAFWPDLENSWGATGDSTDFRNILSTPNWEDLKFAEIRDSGIAVFTLHWRSHPKKDDEWLEKQRRRKSEADIQRELEINYNPISTGRVYPDWEGIERGEFAFDKDELLYASIDFGIADDTAIIWAQRNPVTGLITILDCYSNKGKPGDFYAPFFLGYVPEHRMFGLNLEDEDDADVVRTPWPYSYDEEERKLIARIGDWGPPIVFGDPAGRQRAQSTGDSVIQVLRRYGVHVRVKTDAVDFGSRFSATQLLIRTMRLNYPRCAPLDEAIRAARFPDRSNKLNTNQIRRPVHDRTSHYRSALEYLCVNLPVLVEPKRFDGYRRRLAYQTIR